MTAKLDLINKKFGKLLVLKEAGKDKYRACLWLCKCDCGKIKAVKATNLKLGLIKSCGRCLKITHGMTKTAVYRAWQHMLDRCKNTNNPSYKNYGERGIKVCKRWERFETFYKDMGNPSEGLTLERIDNNKGYFPDNCKWATMKAQSNNSRMNVIIEYQGLKLTMKQWSEKLGINYATLKLRIRRSWPIAKALTEPVRKPKTSSNRSCYHYPVTREISDNG